jgi:hypothetical protein
MRIADIVEAVLTFTVMVAVVRALVWLRLRAAGASERGGHPLSRAIFLGAALLAVAPVMHATAADVAASPAADAVARTPVTATANDPFDVAHDDTVYGDAEAGRTALEPDVLASDAHDDSGFSLAGTFDPRPGNATDPNAGVTGTATGWAQDPDATAHCDC